MSSTAAADAAGGAGAAEPVATPTPTIRVQSSGESGGIAVTPARLILTRTSNATYGLPLDAKTVELELYLKVSALPHDVHYTAYPYSPVAGVLPSITYGRCVATAPESTRYLAAQHCDLDEALSAAERAEVYAFCKLIDSQLPPALAYFLWVDSANYSNVTAPDYAADVPFPLRFFMRYNESRVQRAALDSQRVLTAAEAVARARLCLTALHDKLLLSGKQQHSGSASSSGASAGAAAATDSAGAGEAQFFFGHERPTSLDIATAASVAVLYSAPLRGGEFRTLLHSEFPALLRHSHALVNTHLNYKVPFDLYRLKRVQPASDHALKHMPSGSPASHAGDVTPSLASIGAGAGGSGSGSGVSIVAAARHKTPAAPKPHPIDLDREKEDARLAEEAERDRIDALSGGRGAAERERMRRTKLMLAAAFVSVGGLVLFAKWRASVVAAADGADAADAAASATASTANSGASNAAPTKPNLFARKSM